MFFTCFLVCIAIALIGFLIGAMAEIPRSFLPESVRPDAAVLSKISTAATFKTIFFNNSRVFAAFVVGVLTCGLLSVFETLLIGAMVGFIYKLSTQQGISSELVVASLAPHGIPEVFSFLVVGAVGIYFAVQLYRSSTGRVIHWPSEARAYFFVVAGAYVVLAIAAVMETYLTPLIVHEVLR
ncbi:MAG: stage II sporulation protein M [Acidobacteria bacterium]|nr:stage II sporulation protein M [Acidobacteriota bacterium]